MTQGQKFRRVLLSRWGFFTVASVGLASYVLPLLPEARPNDRVLIWIKIGVFSPLSLSSFWVSSFSKNRTMKKGWKRTLRRKKKDGKTSSLFSTRMKRRNESGC